MKIIKRNIYKELLDWKKDKNKKPLLILGQRQVGKTYIIREFGKNEYKKIVELNFLNNPDDKLFFEKSKGFDNLLNNLINDFDVDPGNIDDYLFFFDEIQECPKAIMALKMINEADLKINLICSGSYLDYKKASFNISFPVGQMKRIKMKQIMFDEFMDAVGRKQMLNLAIEEIKSKKSISAVIHNELLKWFNYYLRIGGFPEVVKTFIENQYTYKKAYEVLEEIHEDYKSDIQKYSEVFNKKEFLLLIYDHITKFLSVENKKWVFQKLDQTKKYRDLEPYLIWLNNSTLIIKIENLEDIQYPLKNKNKNNYFKIYYNDHGFLALNYDLDNRLNSTNFDKIKGALFENFVISQFLNQFRNIYYYSWIKNNNERYEIDFVVANNENESCLIEVKSGKIGKLSSLNQIKNQDNKFKFVLSTNNYEEFETHTNIPIYFAFMLKEIISETE